jgi:hypothetical protein
MEVSICSSEGQPEGNPQSLVLFGEASFLWYVKAMEVSHEIDVISLDAEHRRALEAVMGTPLRRNQRLLISVTDVGEPPAAAPEVRDEA